MSGFGMVCPVCGSISGRKQNRMLRPRLPSSVYVRSVGGSVRCSCNEGSCVVQHKTLLFMLVVQASTIVGLLAGIIQFADGGQTIGAIKYGGVAFAGAMGLGISAITWLKPS